jgi:ubiquinone biosynthesis protein
VKNKPLRTLTRSALFAARILAGLAEALPSALIRRSPLPLAEGLCRSLEKLGPAAIKLGQLLSVRPDLIGAEGALVFERLQDSAPPLPGAVVRGVVEGELLLPITELFSEFDWRPVGCASVSQVHRATLPGGEVVAVKVQRPGVTKLLQEDLEVLERLAALAAFLRLVPRTLDLAAFVRRLREASLQETDFRREGEVAERFSRAFRTETEVVIPRVYWSHTTGRVLTTEFLTGRKISHALTRTGEGYPGLAELGARLFFRQVFQFGLFHADLHPSNIFITDKGKIGYLDFGLWGQLDEGERSAMLGTLVGLLTANPKIALANLKTLGVEVAPHHAEPFADEIGQVLAKSVGPSLAETSMTQLGGGILRAVRRFGIGVPHKYALLIKALLTVEGAARGLHDEFDMQSAARGYLGRLVAVHYGVGEGLEFIWRLAALTALGDAEEIYADKDQPLQPQTESV